MSWGHAVSKDLLHWYHLPVAISEEDNISIFSGSAILDKNNTSGFGTPKQDPICAIYTGYNNKDHRQTQNLAISLDSGYNWCKFKINQDSFF